MKTRSLICSVLFLPSLSLLACESSPELTASGDGDSSSILGDGDGDGDGDVGGDGDGDGDISIGGARGGDGDGDGDGDAPVAVCGNGELEPGELCDDGGTEDGDGCEGDCQSQDPDYDCSEPGMPCVNTVICGNGILEGDEACDDGDKRGGDGCSASCDEVEEGYECARPGVDCVQRPVCGNGERERGEQCDDGEASPDDGDGCTAECQLEDGYFCAIPGEACVAVVCGDGNRTPNEECDDGPGTLGSPGTAAGGDGCSAACTVEPGYRCNQTGCTTVCGDGIVVAGVEECDDENRTSGDGCSAACVQEPFYACSGEPSSCSTTILCDNGLVEPGEICDPVGVDGCLPGCKSFSPTVGGGSTCGNNIIEAGEECDASSLPIPGCTTGCLAVDGWTCTRPGQCFEDPYCGDGILQTPLMEVCDDGDNNDTNGCDNNCQPNTNYTCYGVQPSVCIQEQCGDGLRTPGEICDDDNNADDDGCSALCTIEQGWACPVDGDDCVEKCGDNYQVGDEECDDGNRANGDGCSGGCLIEPGSNCSAAATPPAMASASVCADAVCGDGTQDPLEGCDEGDVIGGDGCGPTCQNEPTITPGPHPTVSGLDCGDGIITYVNSVLEECDDGNQEDGDGCSSACEIELDSSDQPTHTCSAQTAFPEPDMDDETRVRLRVTYRDFKADNVSGGHSDFQNGVATVKNMPGAPCTTSTTECVAGAGVDCPAGTCGYLDSAGKPVHHLSPGTYTTEAARGYVLNANTFSLWYRDTNPTNIAGDNGTIGIDPIEDVLTLIQDTNNPDKFEYDSADDAQAPDPDGHFPLDGLGFGDGGNNHNFHFTTELRYFFQYQGGETLTFRGDDDVWVFINGRLAVDIGGVHGAEWGRVILGDDGDGAATDSNCSAHGTGQPGPCTLEAEELDDTVPGDGIFDDERFGLVSGEIYEIVLFHAERHTTESNFRLTLEGFLPKRTVCTPICGNGIVSPGEVCDEGPGGNNNTDDNNPTNDQTGGCNDTCSGFAYCGDGEPNLGEDCDNGANLDLYTQALDNTACAPGCVRPPYCSDGIVQAAYELCDNGMANSDTAYGGTSCDTACGPGAYCGDGFVDGPGGDGVTSGPETCDKGALNGTEYGPTSCGYDCKQGPYCGDGIRNGAEECDGSANCLANCTYDVFCGDGVKSSTEECDWGQFPSDAYGACDAMCSLGPFCGDGLVEVGVEECDDEEDNDDSLYGGCSTACVYGPRCGDAEVQDDEGEFCDNGFNDDVYMFSENSCAAGCEAPPYCGDSQVQSAYEQCDEGVDNNDNAYDGCTTACEWGPYCGDGSKDPQESCDDGSDNTSYSADGQGCGYDCEPSPYCGDGVRNGPEQCDDGTDDNTGGYGNCRANCTRAPYCGDGIVQSNQGEQCDAGPTGSLACTPTCRNRVVVAK